MCCIDRLVMFYFGRMPKAVASPSSLSDKKSSAFNSMDKIIIIVSTAEFDKRDHMNEQDTQATCRIVQVGSSLSSFLSIRTSSIPRIFNKLCQLVRLLLLPWLTLLESSLISLLSTSPFSLTIWLYGFRKTVRR